MPEPPAAIGSRRISWLVRLSGLAWIILCFELGAFLVVYPWMESWDHNFLANLQPGWRDVWVSPWLRGAISGLGAVNILNSLIELFRYLRQWIFE